jgi:hypothetical protein
MSDSCDHFWGIGLDVVGVAKVHRPSPSGAAGQTPSRERPGPRPPTPARPGRVDTTGRATVAMPELVQNNCSKAGANCPGTQASASLNRNSYFGPVPSSSATPSPRGGLDHRHDAGADRLGKGRPGGHKGGQVGGRFGGSVGQGRGKAIVDGWLTLGGASGSVRGVSGLENCCRVKPTVGSNPTPSAPSVAVRTRPVSVRQYTLARQSRGRRSDVLLQGV